jgi:chromodomain-helicase-DNA-binding protein 1
LQVIQFFRELLKRHNNCGPHLVVVPLSVITSWRTDLQKFGYDEFTVYVHHGDKDTRHDSYLEWFHETKKLRKFSKEKNIALFITTYEVAIKDEHLLSKLSRGSLQWEYLVVRSYFNSGNVPR